MSKRKAISPKKRFQALRRDRFRCVYCGSSPPSVRLEVDHLSPVAEGGTNDLFNLVTACSICNNGKRASLLSPAERFDLIQRVASNAIHNEPLLVTDADEKRGDELVDHLKGQRLRTKGFEHVDPYVARYIILLCIRHGSSWDIERCWIDECTSYVNWLDEQHRFLAEKQRPEGDGNLEKFGVA